MNHPNANRVAVTGLGVICAIGSGREAFAAALREGRSGVAPLWLARAGELRFANAAQVRDFNAEDHFSAKDADMLDRFAQLAVVAAREALAQAGIGLTEELRERAAIVTGSCIGGQTAEDAGFVELYEQGRPRVHPMTIPKTMANAGASAISQDLGITGPAFTISTACASSAHAIGQAFHMVRSGQAPMAIAGGSEAPFSFGILKAWEAMRVVSPTLCRPFSRDRNGMILGEGAAMLLLEPLDAARARGAQPLAEIVGFGMSSDAHHITQPSAEGAAKAIRAALRDAALTPDQIGYINAHGTGTLANDSTEARALGFVFGDQAHGDKPGGRRPAVSSTKAMHGHTLGAAGAIEAAATIIGLQNGFLPPTIHFTEADPECELDVVTNSARVVSVDYAVSNSFAFGGLNAVLAFARAI